MRHVALVGVSGVGKSTFLRKCSETIEFLHLEASSLIKEQKRFIEGASATSEQLRAGVILDNQELLISAFKRRSDEEDRLCVLDGHTVIDTGCRLQKIPASVFGEIGIRKIIILQADPNDIQIRRQVDQTRERPQRTTAELQKYQEVVKEHTCEIGEILGIPVAIVTHDVQASIINV
ncbi:MAG: AAA family ATPase [Roseobacter sp.]